MDTSSISHMCRKSLAITPNTYARLVAIGRKNESFDDIIARLVDFFEKNRESESV